MKHSRKSKFNDFNNGSCRQFGLQTQIQVMLIFYLNCKATNLKYGSRLPWKLERWKTTCHILNNLTVIPISYFDSRVCVVKSPIRAPLQQSFARKTLSCKSTLFLIRDPLKKQLSDVPCYSFFLFMSLHADLTYQPEINSIKHPINKQLLDEVFVISRIIKVEVGVISRSR